VLFQLVVGEEGEDGAINPLLLHPVLDLLGAASLFELLPELCGGHGGY